MSVLTIPAVIVDETQKQFTRFSGDKERDDDGPGVSPTKDIIIRQYIPPGERSSPSSATATTSSSSSPSTSSTSSSPVAGPYPSPVSQAATPNSPKSPLSYQSQWSMEIPRCIGTPVGEQVYSYFLSNFVQGTSLRNHGYLDFLFPLLANEPPGRDHPLPLAFSATAMIAFAARQKVPDLLPRAEATYLRALEATFQAIGDPKKARDNSTLACVTLLTTFEQLRPSRPSYQKAEAFGSHLDGAVALLKMRGKDVFQTVVGRKIFLILRSLLSPNAPGRLLTRSPRPPQVSRSICYATPLEPDLYHLTDSFEQDPSQHRFAELSLRAADLRVHVERLLGGWGLGHAPLQHAPPREAVEALLREADALEADYAAHVSGLPIAWKGMTVRCMTRADPAIMGGIAYVGRVDAYIDMFICYILNWARAARLYVRNTALRCRAWLLGPEGDYRAGPEYAASRALCEALIADIVASVPYVFGAARAGPAHAGRYQPPSLAGVFCMWPVFAAASSDFASETQRTFMKRTLKYISDEMGIGQAAILATYNLRSPSMPIAFTRMKQFEQLGKPLHGVASGAAAGSTMASGLRDIVKTTGTIIYSPPPEARLRVVPLHIHERPNLD
ncbi:putative negative acting factor [Diaporthe ampelina]|uniref:Putative negative acting factor n=1 Tax=Diaporthe ampelina TaxID=1214573 RepID=A0A0G2H9V3_9PEZI|nr:putative negative acting factor [Diaporthe ampelina]